MRMIGYQKTYQNGRRAGGALQPPARLRNLTPNRLTFLVCDLISEQDRQIERATPMRVALSCEADSAPSKLGSREAIQV
jgi:hypothetical protein